MPRKKSKEPRKAALAVYLPPKMLDKLRDVANKDRRSASTQALIFIEQALEQDRD